MFIYIIKIDIEIFIVSDYYVGKPLLFFFTFKLNYCYLLPPYQSQLVYYFTLCTAGLKTKSIDGQLVNQNMALFLSTIISVDGKIYFNVFFFVFDLPHDKYIVQT